MALFLSWWTLDGPFFPGCEWLLNTMKEEESTTEASNRSKERNGMCLYRMFSALSISTDVSKNTCVKGFNSW